MTTLTVSTSTLRPESRRRLRCVKELFIFKSRIVLNKFPGRRSTAVRRDAPMQLVFARRDIQANPERLPAWAATAMGEDRKNFDPSYVIRCRTRLRSRQAIATNRPAGSISKLSGPGSTTSGHLLPVDHRARATGK